MATTSLVLGIVALVLFWTFVIAMLLALLAVAFGIVGLTRSGPAGLKRRSAITGIVTGAVAFFLAPLAFVLAVGLFVNNEQHNIVRCTSIEVTQSDPFASDSCTP